MSSSKQKKHKSQEEEKTTNNMDINSIVNLLDNMDINQLSSLITNYGLGVNTGSEVEQIKDETELSENGERDKRSELTDMLESINNMDRESLLDKIIALYVVNKILRK